MNFLMNNSVTLIALLAALIVVSKGVYEYFFAKDGKINETDLGIGYARLAMLKKRYPKFDKYAKNSDNVKALNNLDGKI